MIDRALELALVTPCPGCVSLRSRSTSITRRTIAPSAARLTRYRLADAPFWFATREFAPRSGSARKGRDGFGVISGTLNSSLATIAIPCPAAMRLGGSCLHVSTPDVARDGATAEEIPARKPAEITTANPRQAAILHSSTFTGHCSSQLDHGLAQERALLFTGVIQGDVPRGFGDGDRNPGQAPSGTDVRKRSRTLTQLA